MTKFGEQAKVEVLGWQANEYTVRSTRTRYQSSPLTSQKTHNETVSSDNGNGANFPRLVFIKHTSDFGGGHQNNSTVFSNFHKPFKENL